MPMAGQIASKAVKEVDKSVRVAGCMPPLQSSYRPDLVQHVSDALPVYKKIAFCLHDYIDLFLCESMSSFQEAEIALLSLEAYNKPIWLSFILDDQFPDQLLSGEKVVDISKRLSSFSIDAILFNCCHPSSISSALSIFDFDGKKGGYANSFVSLKKDWNHSEGSLRDLDCTITSNLYSNYVEEWINNEASIVGGCCGISPEFIQEIALRFSNYK